MKITEGKRLAAILGAYIGIFSLYVLVPATQSHIVWIGLLLTAVFAAVLLFREKRRAFLLKKIFLVALMSVSVVSACLRGMSFYGKTESVARCCADGEIHLARGYVTGISYEENYGSCYTVRLLELDKKETELSTVLSLPYDGALSVGDIVVFESVFLMPEDDFAIGQRADGIFLSAEAERAKRTGAREMKTDGIFEQIRHSIQNGFERYIGGEEAGFATAIMTGNRENLSGYVRLAFTRIGISHILAVSGLHLAIVIGGLDLLFRLIAIPRRLKNVILIGCCFVFACICGLSASIVRAAVMLSLMYFADTLGERHDSLTSLCVAIFLILVCRPTAVYDIGMWMSFLATFGILVTLPAIPRREQRKGPRFWHRTLGFLLSLICATISATFFTLPVTYIAFGGISLMFPLANLIFVPLTQIILYLLVALTLLGGMPFAATPIGAAARDLISFSCDLAERMSDIRGIYVSLRYPFVMGMIAALTLGILAVLVIRKARPVHMFAVFAVCAVFYGIGYFGHAQMAAEGSYVYLETDGKSDAVGMVSQGKTVLVDISTGGYSALSRAALRMEDFYACEIDTLVLTHYHPCHATTLYKLMSRVKIHRIYLPAPSSDEDILCYQTICNQLGDQAELTVYETDGTHSLQAGGLTLSLPKVEFMDRSVHPTVRFSAFTGEKGITYLSEGSTESDLSDSANSVVVFGSHGPSVKHIFDSAPIADAELVIFADKSHAELTETEAFTGTVAFPEDYGGWIKILFE